MGFASGYVCDCGQHYADLSGVYACQDNNHGNPATCRWTEDDDGNWETECGNLYTFIDGGPGENGQKYCGYCGNKLIQE